MSEAIVAIGASVGTLLLIGLFNLVRVAISVPRRTARLEEIAVMNTEGINDISDGLIAVAEAVSGKRCNGNVDDAIDLLRAGSRNRNKYLAANSLGRKPEKIEA